MNNKISYVACNIWTRVCNFRAPDCSGGWVFFSFKEKFVFYIHLKIKKNYSPAVPRKMVPSSVHNSLYCNATHMLQVVQLHGQVMSVLLQYVYANYITVPHQVRYCSTRHHVGLSPVAETKTSCRLSWGLIHKCFRKCTQIFANRPGIIFARSWILNGKRYRQIITIKIGN